jgi:uncharacterized protein (TIGR02217 family)
VGFYNIEFPLTLSALTPKTGWRTQVTELGGGAEQRFGLFADARRRYDARTAGALLMNQFDSVEKFFNGRRGKLHSFKLTDQTNFTATLEGQGTAGGISSTMQLTINRGDSANAYNREIYLPKSGTVHIFANSIEKFSPGDWTLNYSGQNGGLLTWVTNQSGATITATFQYYIPVRFDIDEFPDARLFAYDSGAGTGIVEGPDIPLIEIRYDAEGSWT